MAVVCCSCNSYKKLIYFQDIDRNAAQQQSIDNYKPMVIQPGDILQIEITSANAAATVAFNTPPIGLDKGGYLVSDSGYIMMPVLGEVKVAGLTTAQAHNIVIMALKPYLSEANANLRVVNFKISVLGDVNRPGIYSTENERLNVVQALSLAGDLTVTANRHDLLLIREVNGKREFITLDLTSSKLFQSPYYYLESNDALYIQPDKEKYASVSASSRTIPIVISTISVIAIIITLFRHN